jgi:hypothetical protein
MCQEFKGEIPIFEEGSGKLDRAVLNEISKPNLPEPTLIDEAASIRGKILSIKEASIKNPQFVAGKLPLRKDRNTSFIFIPDMHWPHNLFMDSYLELLKSSPPDYFILYIWRRPA